MKKLILCDRQFHTPQLCSISQKENLIIYASKLTLLEALPDAENTAEEIHWIGYLNPYGPVFGSPWFPHMFTERELRDFSEILAKNARIFFYTHNDMTPFVSRISENCESSYFILNKKYNGRKLPEMFRTPEKFFREQELTDPSVVINFDSVSSCYVKAFSSVDLRQDEMKFLLSELGEKPARHLLDIGCGNGALMRKLYEEKVIETATGIDVSAEQLKAAVKLCKGKPFDFIKVNGIPGELDNRKFDVIVSFLSFRYLSWEEYLPWFFRHLEENGRLIIVDLCSNKACAKDFPGLVHSYAGTFIRRFFRFRKQYGYLKKMKRMEMWPVLLKHHPGIDYTLVAGWLSARVPGGRMQILNNAKEACVISFVAENKFPPALLNAGTAVVLTDDPDSGGGSVNRNGYPAVRTSGLISGECVDSENSLKITGILCLYGIREIYFTEKKLHDLFRNSLFEYAPVKLYLL